MIEILSLVNTLLVSGQTPVIYIEAPEELEAKIKSQRFEIESDYNLVIINLLD